jgi:hypothetical protein
VQSIEALIRNTQNANDEVLGLFALAANLRVDHIIAPGDLGDILRLYPVRVGPVSWEPEWNPRLAWGYEEDSSIADFGAPI